jgi:hypothetical protein
MLYSTLTIAWLVLMSLLTLIAGIGGWEIHP